MWSAILDKQRYISFYRALCISMKTLTSIQGWASSSNMTVDGLVIYIFSKHNEIWSRTFAVLVRSSLLFLWNSFTSASTSSQSPSTTTWQIVFVGLGADQLEAMNHPCFRLLLMRHCENRFAWWVCAGLEPHYTQMIKHYYVVY